jgi:hypothetical protein
VHDNRKKKGRKRWEGTNWRLRIEWGDAEYDIFDTLLEPL